MLISARWFKIFFCSEPTGNVHELYSTMKRMISQCKKDFPILNQKGTEVPLTYLDNAATSQKPKQVIEAISTYYATANANVHRGVHRLSDASTTAYEKSREIVARFFGAKTDELIFVRNTTEATNGLAYGWGDNAIKEGDVIVTSLMEHHSSIVVWQQLAKRNGARLKVVPITKEGLLDIDALESILKSEGSKVALVAFAHVSNTLGCVTPVAKVGTLLKTYAPQSRFYLDAAQSAPHMSISFAALQKQGVDFMAVSGHKMLAPMGIGCLLVRRELMETGEMQPWLFGGGMIGEVSQDTATFHDDFAEKFTAGTPDVASAVGFAAACEYLTDIGMKQVYEHDVALVKYAYTKLKNHPKITIIGPNPDESERVGSVAFLFEGVHAHDVAQILDSKGVAVRSGHHCTMPLHTHFRWASTARASFQIYNSTDDIDVLVQALDTVTQIFTRK